MTNACVDPRDFGVGVGDVVDVVIRGRVTRVGELSVALVVAADENRVRLSGAGDGTGLHLWVPAEAIVTMARDLEFDHDGALA